MTFTIPVWLLFSVGLLIAVPLILAILVLAWFGYVALSCIAGGVR